MISDLNGDGCIQLGPNDWVGNIPYIAPEIIQEEQYYPFGMAMEDTMYEPYWAKKDAYGYNGKELNTDIGLGWMDYGARWYDAAIGRWNAVDPHAENYHPWATYNYVGNDPITRIDLDGRDWYEAKDGSIAWFNKKDETFTEDENEWKNIGEERLYFGGEHLIYYTQNEDEEGKLTLETHVFEADSGKPLSDGTFDYSDERQATKSEGPIPEGDDYSVNARKIQFYDNLSLSQKIASGVGKGQWPGGRTSWGDYRVWIEPYEIDVIHPDTKETITRTGMTIHGGSYRGSAGCIDLCKNAPAFFKELSKSTQTNIRLTVSYPESLK